MSSPSTTLRAGNMTTPPPTETDEPRDEPGHSGNGIIIGIVVIVIILCCGGIIGYFAVKFYGKKAGIDDKQNGGKGGRGKSSKKNAKSVCGKTATKMHSVSGKQKIKANRSSTLKRRASRKSTVTPKDSFLKQNVKAATLKKRSSTVKKRLSRSVTISRKKVVVPASPKNVQPHKPKLVKMDTTLKSVDYTKIDQAISRGAKVLKSRSKSKPTGTQPKG